jgi:hypothetical protein
MQDRHGEQEEKDGENFHGSAWVWSESAAHSITGSKYSEAPEKTVTKDQPESRTLRNDGAAREPGSIPGG